MQVLFNGIKNADLDFATVYDRGTCGGSPLDARNHSVLQPKYDGVRAFVMMDEDSVVVVSRGWRELTISLPEFRLNEHLRKLGRRGWTVLDCELIAYGEDSLNKMLKTFDSLTGIRAHAFDILWHEGKDVRTLMQSERLALLERLEFDGLVSHVPRVSAPSHAERTTIIDRWIEEGYEGAVLKSPTAAYGEPHSWLRWKQKMTVDAQIVGWREGRGRTANSIASLDVAVLGDDGELTHLCRVSPGSNDVRLSLMAKSAFLDDGQSISDLNIIVELEAQKITSNGKLRHPRFKRFRPDKSAPNTLRSIGNYIAN